MNELFLIRHGIAADPEHYATDADRPLTEDGIQKTRRVAKRFHDLDLHWDLILSSPLIRARQTSEFLLAANLSETLEISDLLAPGGHIQDWLSWFQTWRQSGRRSLALVGHEPNLGHWAEWLCWGESRDRLIVKKAGIIGIKLPLDGELQGNGQLFWLAPPRLLL
jgi:phosphohistidine phosphatase